MIPGSASIGLNALVLQCRKSGEIDVTYGALELIDVRGIASAMLTNLIHLGSDRRPIGASTITQQVAKNFLLGNEVSLKRKVREIILALRLE